MFNLDLKEVDYERMKAWCAEEVPEGETIEYKREFPSGKSNKLEKVISAMANSHGGIILIGVVADPKTNKPKAIPGVEFKKGLEEKVTGICLRSIYPPVFPQVKPSKFEDKNKNERAVVFIRVYESDLTHAINNNTDVYIRIKSQTEPFERKATQKEVGWLRDRRTKAIAFREQLLSRARARYQSKTLSDRNLQNWYREIYVIPLFPQNMLFSYDEFFNVLKKLENDAQENGFKTLMHIVAQESKSAADSLYTFKINKGEEGFPRFISYEEYNIFGLIYRKESFWESSVRETQESFDVKSFLSYLYYVVKFGLLLYKAMGYNGVIKIGVQVKGLLSKKIEWIGNDFYSRFWGKNEMDNIYVFEDNLLCSVLEDKLDKLLLQIYKKFLWSVGVKHIDELVKSMVGEINKVKSSFKK